MSITSDCLSQAFRNFSFNALFFSSLILALGVPWRGDGNAATSGTSGAAGPALATALSVCLNGAAAGRVATACGRGLGLAAVGA
jgi:hypothetical protein